MEWNKDEATRAKEIAEKKMENKDFVGAQKVALRAQQLYSGLEDLSQMIMVCDVHCSAESKLFGNEKDWYAILKLDPSADETIIRKQYRKFALLLHPDKNKFHGAADAFKLISEAQKVLLDRDKRILYDSRYKSFGRSSATNWVSQNARRQPNTYKQTRVQNDIRSNVSAQFMNQTEPPPHSAFVNRPTFWTSCPFCGVRYQYYRELVNKVLVCQNCKRAFTAYEIIGQGTVSGNKVSQPPKVEAQSVFTKSAAKVRSQEPRKEAFPKAGCTSEVFGMSESNADAKIKSDGQSEEHKNSMMHRKRSKRRLEESSESCGIESSSDSDKDNSSEPAACLSSRQMFGFSSEQQPRRSTRSRKHVSYNENLSDDDVFVNPSGNAKGTRASHGSNQQFEEACDIKKFADSSGMKEDDKETKQKYYCPNVDELNNWEEKTNAYKNGATSTKDEIFYKDSVSESCLSPENFVEPKSFDCFDPEFSNFDKNRTEECFDVDQIWAVYDTRDAMPRFYAIIKKVCTGLFKVQITWLEPAPTKKHEKMWIQKELPFACGSFKQGHTEYTEDLPMFSHISAFKKMRKKGGGFTYNVLPRTGETWALFKDWDKEWITEPGVRMNFRYELIVVLSDFEENIGIRVAYLSKKKGFVCLFGQVIENGNDSTLIGPDEMLRFSHRIPSVLMTGEEREDVPSGSFELDPASLPNESD